MSQSVWCPTTQTLPLVLFFLPVSSHYLALFFVCLSLLYSPTHIGGGGTTLRSPVYNLLPVDLRTPPAASLAPLLASGSGKDDEPLLSPSLPTLLLFECVLAYMTPDASNALIRWFVDYFAAAGATAGPLGGVVYEMFKLNDAFGRVMLNNLKVRARASPLSLPMVLASC